jgi:hypothetical protein
MVPKSTEYWFPAKKYGLGWGLPVVWQGWVVLAVFVLLVAVGVFVLLPHLGPLIFVPYCGILCIGLVVVGWLKGEPLGWRWGKK